MTTNQFNEIYTLLDGEKVGPFTLEEFKSGILNGTIPTGVKVNYNGCGEDYVNLRTIPGVKKVLDEWLKKRMENMSLGELVEGAKKESEKYNLIGEQGNLPVERKFANYADEAAFDLSKKLILKSRDVLINELSKKESEHIACQIVTLSVEYAKTQGMVLETAQGVACGAIHEGGGLVAKNTLSAIKNGRPIEEAVRNGVISLACIQWFRHALKQTGAESEKSVKAFLYKKETISEKKTASPAPLKQYVEGISKSYLYSIMSKDPRLSHRLECTKLTELDYTIPINGSIGAFIVIGIGAAFFGGPAIGAAVIGAILVFWVLAAQQLEKRKMLLDSEVTKFAQAVDDINAGRDHSHRIEKSNGLVTIILHDTSDPRDRPILPPQLIISGNHWAMEQDTAKRLGFL